MSEVEDFAGTYTTRSVSTCAIASFIRPGEDHMKVLSKIFRMISDFNLDPKP